MAFLDDFTTGFGIGRHVARDGARGQLSTGDAQDTRRQNIITQLYPGPVSSTVALGIRFGENLFLTIAVIVVGIVLVGWLLL